MSCFLIASSQAHENRKAMNLAASHRRYYKMAYARRNEIIGFYRSFLPKRAVMLYDIESGKIYAYPYAGFKADLSPRSQAILAREYKEAGATGQIVVFVRDNVNEKLVSFCVGQGLP